MAKLEFGATSSIIGEMEIKIELLASTTEDLLVHFRYLIPGNDSVVITGSTRGWQVGWIYFETLSRAFITCREFAKCHFPVSYYSDSSKRLPHCTLHLDIEWLQIFLRGVRNDKMFSVDCFVCSDEKKQYTHIKFVCSFEQAEKFGLALLDEINLLKEATL